MTLASTLSRLTLAAALLASLGACTVVPAYPTAYPAGYRAAPVYVETYPAYRPAPPVVYYGYERGYRDDRRDYYRDDRRRSSPLEDAARVHRDIRRSLGLPRLPGMP